jgi:hypothetical protein
MRPRPALALVCLLVGLVSAGCGSSAATTTAATQPEQAWQLGLSRWSREMQGALDGMSRVFASAAAVQALEAGHHGVDLRIAGYEATLSACSARVRSLGPPPKRFVVAHHFAVRACAYLERGARLIGRGVTQFQAGFGADLFTQAAEPLSDGQSDIGAAKNELASPP